ncbi:MAG TPA: M20/M25/M40 family metallo-hydrolase, partial [bacterium]|nr:M20/M25/M40 family metallo-hydrolase [bacterium]
MRYNDSIPKIPAAAISTQDANNLSAMLTKGQSVKVRMKLTCETLADKLSYNVVGEIRGTEKPEEVIVIGGHLDSWDKGTGAHDDGAGVVHSIEALRLMKATGLLPKRTVRVVLFMNEENGVRGGKGYAAVERPNEKHIAALESDGGGHAPRGFGIEADSVKLPRITRFESLLKIIDADRVGPGHGGTDIEPLGKTGVPCIGLHPDPQRYFDYHHSDHDTIDKVHDRELELGAIAMAILTYAIAFEGI